ncbi:MAG TPA: SRPBCC family protein [Gemmatimonadales bacterium]|nr:SRPBCC family protein [Gemmatimonadales bacterium]
MTFVLERRQVMGGELGDVFAFFKDPYNLEMLTPPWLGFRVLDASDARVRLGTRIRYALRLHGVPLRWESRISEYAENAMFVDEQLSGPYASWHHRHRFRPVPGGVEMADTVAYRLPLGPLGRAAHAAFVRRQLAEIFDFRARRVAELFPLPEAALR